MKNFVLRGLLINSQERAITGSVDHFSAALFLLAPR
jgi:hypothetical protein